MVLPVIEQLPKGWPPLGPSQQIIDRLHEGSILSTRELEQLRNDAARAYQLEQTDPDFLRAVRRYRAQCAEEDRIIDVKAELEQRAKAVYGQKERVKRQRKAKEEARQRRRERGNLSRQEVDAQREQKRTELMERIALAERRTLVRETIQKALVSQSRADPDAQRTFFTDAKFAPEGPGPAAYALPDAPRRGPSFGPAPGESSPPDIRTKPKMAPGPGSYDPKYSGGPAISFGADLRKQSASTASLPGPGAYDAHAPIGAGKGGRISSHRVKSELDFALDRAAAQPGPGEYELHQLDRGKSSTMSGRTRGTTDMMMLQNARRPGPGAYEVVPGRVRGGVFALDDARQLNQNSTKLPAIAPGPGSYHQTPTIRQEAEMRQLSRQVVQLVRNRSSLTSKSAPETLQKVSGRRARTQAGSAQRTAVERDLENSQRYGAVPPMILEEAYGAKPDWQ